MVTPPGNCCSDFKTVNSKNCESGIRVEETSFSHFQGAYLNEKWAVYLIKKKFDKLEKNPKTNTTKPNNIYIAIERSLSVNIYLWIILAVPSGIINKMDV